MKKLSLKKEIMLVILVIVAVLAMSTRVLATQPINFEIPGTSTTTNDEIPNVNENTTNTVNDTVQPNAQNTQNTVSNYQNTTLPQTGDASDYAIFMLIVVAVIIAVYAYKKVRDYNI